MVHRRTLIWVLIGLAMLSLAGWWLGSYRMEFDEKRWQAATSNAGYERRYRMMASLERLIASGELNDRDTVLRRLGTPDQERGTVWLYNLGPEHGSLMQVDHDWLELVFDGRGKLVSHRVRPD